MWQHLRIRRHNLHLITFVHLFSGIKEQSRLKPFELLLRGMRSGVSSCVDGQLEGGREVVPWAVSEGFLDLPSCGQGRVSRGRQNIPEVPQGTYSPWRGVVMCLQQGYRVQCFQSRDESSTCRWSHEWTWALSRAWAADGYRSPVSPVKSAFSSQSGCSQTSGWSAVSRRPRSTFFLLLTPLGRSQTIA